MDDARQSRTLELSLEFLVELLLFLYPYGADQMGLPHNFWIGLASWVIGIVIGIRFFWIFPLWNQKIQPTWKSVIAAIVVICFITVAWNPVLTAYKRKEQSEGGFRVVFKTELVDMNRNLEKAPLWVLYRSGYGDTISPVALFAFVEITNLYAHPVSVSSYSVAIKTDTCGWSYLTPIDARGVKLLWAGAGLNSAPIINLENHAFNYLWDKPIPAYDTKLGMLLFDTKVECPVQVGSPVQFKMDIRDSAGKSFSYASPEMLILKTFTLGNSVGQENIASVEFIGLNANVSQAYRRLYSDPIPDVIKNDKRGTASMFSGGKTGTIVLQDGAFYCPSCSAPKQQLEQ
jgi:hypothetical protein